jgi:hypothetical protein
LFRTSSEFIDNIELSTLALSSRVTRNSTFPTNGKYGRSFNPSEKIKIETGAQLVSENQNELTFPATYSSDEDSYIRLPNDWVNYFPNEESVKFVGIQIKPEYVNTIFPRSLNRYATGWFYRLGSSPILKVSYNMLEIHESA